VGKRLPVRLLRGWPLPAGESLEGETFGEGYEEPYKEIGQLKVEGVF